MPYISAKDDRREKLRNGEPALLAGELNYQIFYYVKHNIVKSNYVLLRKAVKVHLDIINKFVKQFLGNKPNYQKYNDMTGCLIRCSREIGRRLISDPLSRAYLHNTLLNIVNSYDGEIAKYEDKKIKENGDVE